MFTGFATLNRNPQASSRRLLLSLMIFVALFAFRGLKPMDGINVAYFFARWSASVEPRRLGAKRESNRQSQPTICCRYLRPEDFSDNKPYPRR